MKNDTGKPSWKAAVTGNVLMMGLVSLFTDFSSEMIYPLLPAFIGGLVSVSAAPIVLGLMEGVAESTASLIKLFSGRLSDRLGKRKLLAVLGYGLSTVVRPLMALATAGWHVIAFRFVDRVGKGIRTSPRDALIGDSVGPERRGLAFSFHRAMDHTGAVLGPVVAGVILFAFLGGRVLHGEKSAAPEEMRALKWLFALALVPGLAAMVTLALKVREIAPKRESASTDGLAVSVWKRLPRRFYYFVGIVTLFALANSSDLFLLYYGKTLFKFGVLQILALWVGLHLLKMVFSIVGGLFSDRFGRRPAIVIGWGVYALVYLGMALVAAEWQFWALFLVYGLYYGMTEGAEKALVADFTASEHRGTAFGLYHSAVGFAAFPASLVFGVFWGTLGPQVAFGIGAALAGVAAVLLVVLLSAARKEKQA